MFFLKKLISYFILPPGIYVIAFLFISFLSKGKFLRRFALLCALSLYLISVEPIKDLLIYPLENYYKKPEVLKGDAIVVLGGGVYNNGRLKASSFKRLITGFLLYKELKKPIILSGGASINVIPEAKVMKELLRSFGVPEEDIYTDVRSRDTFENAKFVKEMCEKLLKCKEVILVTSGFHMPRAVGVFKKAGLEVIPYPTDLKFEGKYNVYSLFPKYSVFYDSSIAIREYIGLLFYKLKGLL
ncbi:YdcF family protein [Aquifex aeolicus]|uniref:DUF218 domain-containing protein n=1 Tax=Aquifex aeolicus (strain VF5) TaxID=224324 RepID=O67793_AQUAE|nr:YdcF family protein [Aquifex aeolicus]AAC07762.1 hypothetical protein aq_1986 [Aquifex aeolicus VF5]